MADKAEKAEKTEKPEKLDFSKKTIQDVRALLWVVTVGGLLLAVISIHAGYIGSLPWITTLVGLPWAAHATITSFYMNMAKSDHKEGGITFETAKAANFGQTAASVSTDTAVGSMPI